MKIFFCGFNLYGQFPHDSNAPTLSTFTEITLPNNAVALELSHTFNFALTDKPQHLIIYGSSTKTVPTTNFTDHTIVQIASTDTRLFALTSTGQIFKFDLTDQPATFGLHDSPVKFNKLACGTTMTVALASSGHLYNIPNRLPFEAQVEDFCVGHEHCVLLDRSGNVYTFGRGSRGQLGHGDLDDIIGEPRQVDALAGIKIVKVTAGGWHSGALSEEGDLYTWGWNNDGQLGVGRTFAVMATPHVVDFEESKNVVLVACGSRHTVALLDDGKLYGTGLNKYHQLGEVGESVDVMTCLYDFCSFKVTDLKCGPWSTAVFVN